MTMAISNATDDGRQLGEKIVAEAKPGFRDFRVDFERLSNAASKACRERGLGDLAAAMFFDLDWALRLPLQRRYADVDAWDAISHYHLKLVKSHGRNTPWPDAPALTMLELFAARGRAQMAVALIRAYGDMQLKRLRQDLSKRKPRGPRKNLDEGVKRAIGVIDKAIAGAIPDRKRDLLRDLESVACYVESHGSADDLAWFEAVRREVWMERRA